MKSLRGRGWSTCNLCRGLGYERLCNRLLLFSLILHCLPQPSTGIRRSRVNVETTWRVGRFVVEPVIVAFNEGGTLLTPEKLNKGKF